MNDQEYRKLGIELATQYLQDIENNSDPNFDSVLRFNLISAVNMAGYSNVEEFKKEFGQLT